MKHIVTVGLILANLISYILYLNWLLIGKGNKRCASIFTEFLSWAKNYTRQLKYATLFNHKKEHSPVSLFNSALNTSLPITKSVEFVPHRPNLQHQLDV